MCSKLKSIYPMLFFGSETNQKGCSRTKGIMLAILHKKLVGKQMVGKKGIGIAYSPTGRTHVNEHMQMAK